MSRDTTARHEGATLWRRGRGDGRWCGDACGGQQILNVRTTSWRAIRTASSAISRLVAVLLQRPNGEQLEFNQVTRQARQHFDRARQQYNEANGTTYEASRSQPGPTPQR